MSSVTEKNDEEEAGGVLEISPPHGDHGVVDDSTNLQYDGVSNSSLTGEFTTITNVLDGHADGMGAQDYNSPARSTFEVVGVVDAPNSIDGSNLGSYDSYYQMQKNGPPIVPESEGNVRTHSIMRYGWRGGGMSGLTGSSLADTVEKDEGIEIERFREDASESNTNDRASSLSSLTNDFFPKINRRERRFFSSPARNNRPSLVEAQQGSISPTSSNDKSSSQSSKMLQKLTPPRIKRSNLVHDSPWYVNKHHRDASTPSPQNSSDQTPMGGHLPGEVLVSSPPKVTNSDPSNPTPSVISSSNMSQYFSNELREIYNSNAYRSYRHHYEYALSSPKAKRIMISSVILAALFAIIAIVAISLGARPQNQAVIEASSSSYYDTTQRNGDTNVPVLPEKCCIDKPDDKGLIETDIQDRIESATGEGSKAPSPSASPIQNTPPTIPEQDWDYVVIISTPQPTPGSVEDTDSAAIPTTPTPTLVEDSNGWRPSILPSWIQSGEKLIPIVTLNPTRKPTRRPTRKPTRRPTRRPTRKPTRKPTKQPTTKKPTRSPTTQPTSSPTTLKPTNAPVVSSVPTKGPTISPITEKPTVFTPSPTSASSISPTPQPSTVSPTTNSTPSPTSSTTAQPSTSSPSAKPPNSTLVPTPQPQPPSTLPPTPEPSANPTSALTTQPPTVSPTAKPSHSPTSVPTSQPSKATLTPAPSPKPTSALQPNPTSVPTPASSTLSPTHKPTAVPTSVPTSLKPTVSPVAPSSKVFPISAEPTPKPTPNPTIPPATSQPTPKPTSNPTTPPATSEPTPKPTPNPTNPPATKAPTPKPSSDPTNPPATKTPTSKPTPKPTPNPTNPPATKKPTPKPTKKPSPSPAFCPGYPNCTFTGNQQRYCTKVNATSLADCCDDTTDKSTCRAAGFT